MTDRRGTVSLERFQDRLHAATARMARSLACLLLAVAVALIATGFLSAALYLALDERLGSTAAAALVGGLLLAVTLALLLIANQGIRRTCRAGASGACAVRTASTRQRPGDAEHGSPSELAASLGALVGDETVKWTRKHPFSALAAALVAGIAVGVSPRLRDELEQVMGALSGKSEPGRREP